MLCLKVWLGGWKLLLSEDTLLGILSEHWEVPNNNWSHIAQDINHAIIGTCRNKATVCSQTLHLDVFCVV